MNKSALSIFAASFLWCGVSFSQMWEDGMRGSMTASKGSMQPAEAPGATLKFYLPFNSGESSLDGDDLTLNSITRTAECAYAAKGYSGSNWAGTQGETLNEVISGASPDLNYGPFSDGTKTVYITHGQNLFNSPTAANCTIEDEDIVFEMAVRVPSEAFGVAALMNVFTKYPLSGIGAKWSLSAQPLAFGTNLLFSATDDAAASAFILLGSIQYDTWHHVVLVWDRQTGMRTYIDGVPTSFNAAIASVNGNIDAAATKFSVAGLFVTAQFLGDISFFKIWKGADDSWISTTSHDDAMLERFQRVAGYWPKTKPESSDGLMDFTRASSATFTMWDGSAGVDSSKVHKVGAGWPRISCRGQEFKDSSNRICGATVERQAKNEILHSEDITAAGWSSAGTPVTRAAGTEIAPDGKPTGDELRASNTSDITHGFQNAVGGAGPATVSAYFKAGAVGHVSVRMTGSSPMDGAQFDITNCTVGPAFSAVYFARAERLGAAGSWCRVSVSGTVSGPNVFWYFTDHEMDPAACLINFNTCAKYAASNTIDPQVYAWGAQVERYQVIGGPATYEPSTYIKTNGVAITRLSDSVKFDSAGIYTDTDFLSASYIFQSSDKRFVHGGLLEPTFPFRFSAGSLGTDYFAFELGSNTAGTETGAPRFFVETGGVSQAILTSSSILDDGLQHSVTGIGRTNDFSLYADRVLSSTDLAGSMPSAATIDTIHIGTYIPDNLGSQGIVVDEIKIYHGREVR